ncbi:MAG: HDOD domain-containing protein [bacterium]|nr:HDOD domain-containing protein [bacterium]
MDTKKILNSARLPTLSKTLYEIIELEKRNPISFSKEVRNIVEKDPLLSAHILKIANSPLYGFSQEVRTLSHAIGLLGMRKIRNIAFTYSIFDFFKKANYQPEFGETFNLILKKSLLYSAVSTILAKKANHSDLDESYISGLLADIGQIILFLHAPTKYHRVYSPIDKQLIEKEKKTFKTDHIKLGIAFCDQWKFPEFIKEGIKNHLQLSSDKGHAKISYIANQLTELLLADDDEEKKSIFKEIESQAKKLLHLSLTEVEETIKALPDIMETYISDFPELQKDLQRIIETGSSLIITLMKKEMDMVILTQELTDSQKRLAKEKIFLSHMLNLSYFLSSLISPQRVISSLFEYFENFISEFTIEFIYKESGSDDFCFSEGKNQQGGPIDLTDFPSLVKSRLSNEAVRMETGEIKKLKKDPGKYTLIFPISYHNNFFGFLLLNVIKENYLAFDLEMSYVQILANIIANSFQNYFSFQGLKNETSKNKLVTRELFKFDKELDQSKKNLLKLQKNEILGEMLPVIFHKLKNKLTPILGYSQILMSKVKDDAIKNRINKIEKNANELTEQLNFLRDYFKGDEHIEEKENLNIIINHLKPYFNEIEELQNIKIHMDLDSRIPEDRLIPGQIEVLVTNIVENAVQSVTAREEAGGFARGKGKVTIKTRLDDSGDSYILSIRDNGIGMGEKDIYEIWAPFYSKFPNKAGLGLSICEKILSNHEAGRSVQSAKGEYTEFIFTFTVKYKAVEPGEPVQFEETPRSELHGKILIVDDEAYLLDLMSEILMNEADFDITTTTSGTEALDLVDDSFDLIISDIRMPETDGMEIYDYLRSIKMADKVIMVTADPYSEDVAKFLHKNNVEYLRKPFELMEFKKKVLDKLS